ncbi:MAG: sodium:calcium antiporter [Cenarchaeum symbiont of Oopsacas minuta]|nr:sodium:calcium antiporter [Cenarchaeum symbiont of Oopsacas minuta]
MDILVSIILVVTGLAMLCYGGNWLVDGGIVIAKRFRISPLIIGMTVVAYGTSAPELATSLAAGTHGAIVLGNVVGSNIANIGMVIGIAAILTPLAIKKRIVRTVVPIMIGFSLLLVVLSFDGELNIYDGTLLLGLLLAFTIYTYKTTRSMTKNKQEKIKIDKKSIVKLVFGVALLYVGSILAVNNMVDIANDVGISEKVIGITVLAIGTSLPELVTSIAAIKRGETNIGIGNIIGSNIYNILMIVGITSIIFGITVPKSIEFDYIVMMAFGLAMLIAFRGKINMTIGIILVVAYAMYMLFLITN